MTLTSKVYGNTHNNASILYKNFFFTLFLILTISTIALCTIYLINVTSDASSTYKAIDFRHIHKLPLVQVTGSSARPRHPNCTHWDCFNIYKCGHTGHERIAVYVYPLKSYVDEDGQTASDPMSRQYFELLQTIVKSKYYTANPHEACFFVPSIDTLNEARIRTNLTSRALQSLPFWNNGENHVIFNMMGGNSGREQSPLGVNTGLALIAAADFHRDSFRRHFDISLPLVSPLRTRGITNTGDIHHNRSWFVVSSQLNINPSSVATLSRLSTNANHRLLVVDACEPHNFTKRCDSSGNSYNYPAILQESTFCLIFKGDKVGQLTLIDSLEANCIPVVVIDGFVMPFSSVIDWRRAAVFVIERYLHTLFDVLAKIPEKRIRQMRQTGRFLYDNYFATMEKVTATTLDILQERVYPHLCRNMDEWNLRSEEKSYNPLFLPYTAPKSHGFTAVILTYDRVQSLFVLIERLAKVPSLRKIIVVWNNQEKQPPAPSTFPQVDRPVKVIRTSANKLSNRFYPYDEIKTEAVLHIDDDIVMLTSDEVEFAYETWREFPERIVGFPSRTHRWDNLTQTWKYESEWTNEISMVLTGAAFLHKYWSFAYTHHLPPAIRQWVDAQMNCEDIAMNFLVANQTRKAPIKVTPRKKFKCPECTNNEMLSADVKHMTARSTCVDRFARIFGRMPLITVEFRADPVLFKDPFPEKLKRFNDIGSL